MNAYLDYLKQLSRYFIHHAHRLKPHLLRPPAPQLPSSSAPLLPSPRYRLDIGHPERVVILLVGCGGTGSFAAHSLAQLAVWAKGAGLDLRLYFVDPDVIEEKNLVRQNFCPAEIGQPKALSLAWRYTAAFGLNIIPVLKPFSADLLTRLQPQSSPQGTLTLLVGAVDNVAARRDMAQAITTRLAEVQGTPDKLFWLDAGNEQWHGQVLLGNSLEPEPRLSPLGYCLSLPLPHLQEPSLLQDRLRPPTENLSCAELTALGEQSAMINRAMATWLGVYSYRLLQSRDLDLRATFLNLKTGMTRSIPISEGRVVLPERPRLRPLRPVPADHAGCPDCGGQRISGEDTWQGVIVGVRFCADCPWRAWVCPLCGGDLSEEGLEENGQLIPFLSCDACDWQTEVLDAPA